MIKTINSYKIRLIRSNNNNNIYSSQQSVAATKARKQTQRLLLLSFVEAWERFSYYGMRALLILYLVTHLGFADPQAYAIYSLFAAICYGVPPISGYLADRYLGFRRVTMVGGGIMCLGHLAMACTQDKPQLIYLGLALIAVGSGFFKGNITNLLGAVYSKTDPARQKAFTWFYVAVNIGGGAASIACGYAAEIFGYHYGFSLAGIGMLLGMIVFIWGRPLLGDVGDRPGSDKTADGPETPERSEEEVAKVAAQQLINSGLLLTLTIAIGLIVFAFLVLNNSAMIQQYTWIPGLLGLALLGRCVLQLTPAERVNIAFLMVLMLTMTIFFAFEMQLGSVINLFTARNVDTTIWGNYRLPPASLQALNPLAVILFGSAFAGIFQRFGETFSIKRVLLGLGANALSFLVILLGGMRAEQGEVALIYLVLAMMLMAFTEICLGPVIQSLFASIAPQRIRGFMMGVLMLGLSYSNLAGIVISRFVAVDKEAAGDKLLSLAIYNEAFYKAAIFCALFCLFFALLVPWMQKILNQNLAVGKSNARSKPRVVQP